MDYEALLFYAIESNYFSKGLKHKENLSLLYLLTIYSLFSYKSNKIILSLIQLHTSTLYIYNMNEYKMFINNDVKI